MAAKKFGTQLDLQKIPLKGLVPEVASVAPTSPGNNQLWVDSSVNPNRLKVYYNGAWVVVATLDATGKVAFAELPTGTGAAQVAVGNHNHDGVYSPVAHNHDAAYAPISHSHDAGDVTSGVFGIARIPTGTTGTTVALGNHTHPLGNLSDVVLTTPSTAQVLRYNGTNWVNAAVALADVTGLTAALAGKANSTHTHDAADVASGTLDIARLPVASSGTANTTQVVRADDTRLSNARTPTGTAGGDLTGTYPNPTVGNLAITDAKVAAANKDGAVGTPSMRTLGTGAQQALAGNTRLDQIAAPTAAVSLGSQRITNLATPTVGTDAATKDYVDAARLGLDVKAPVRVATTANIALTGLQAIDGVTVVAGDRVLVKNQTTGSQNGIYVAASGAWARATDADTSAEVNSGMFTFVTEGNTLDNSGWVLATNNPITLNTTALAFTQFSGAGSLNAGAGLTQTGSTFDVVAADGSITVAADSITVGNVPVTKGGTGSTTAAGARTALGAVGKYAQDMAALTAGAEQTITHNLNTTDVQAMFRTLSDNADIILDWRVINANSIGVTADLAFAASAIRAVVMG